MLVSTISGRPGTLRDFVNSALPSGTQLNITELRHRYAFMPQSDICCSASSLPAGCNAAASWQPTELCETQACMQAVPQRCV